MNYENAYGISGIIYDMADENLEFEIELDVIDPLKIDQKEEVIQKISSFFSENEIDAKLGETFYVEKRGTEILEALHMIFITTSPYVSMASLILGIIAYLKSKKGGRIKVKKSTKKVITITSEMTEEEIKEKLEFDE